MVRWMRCMWMDGEGDMGGGGWLFLWTSVYRSVFV